MLPITDIEAYVPKRANVLDIGCGYGLLDIYLATTSEQRKVVGLDANAQRIRTARVTSQDISNIEFLAADLLSTDLPKDIDCILLIDLLHHTTYIQQEGLIDSVATLLEQGGKFIIKEIERDFGFKYYWNLFHDKVMTFFDELYYLDEEDLTRTLEDKGFSVSTVRLRHPFYGHYLMICEMQ